MVAYVLLSVSLAALMAAFVAQWLVPTRRTKTIFAAAAAPSALLTVAMIAYAFAVGLEQSFFQAVITIAFWFIVFMFVGLVAAIVGTELASFVGWLTRRDTG